MATLDLTAELTVPHPDDPNITVTLRWTDRSRHGPTEQTRAALLAALASMQPRRPLCNRQR